MNSKRLSELRYKGYITDSEYKELKLAIKALEERPLAITNEDIHLAIKEGFANGYSMAKAKYERPTVVAKNATSDRPQGDLISREALIKAVEQGEGISWERHKKDDLCVRKKYIDNAPTVEYPEQIIIKCDTEEDKQKLLSALRNARLTICEEADND